MQSVGHTQKNNIVIMSFFVTFNSTFLKDQTELKRILFVTAGTKGDMESRFREPTNKFTIL